MEVPVDKQVYDDEFINWAQRNWSLLLMATFGASVLLFCLIKLLYHAVRGFRLYVLSQCCCSTTDYVKRYGRWAVISGATDGIGLAMARELARRGHSLVVIGRNETKLLASKESLEKEENVGEVVTIKIDLSDSSVQNFESIREKLTGCKREIGILINNAGISTRDLKRFHRYELRELSEVINVNVLAAVYLTNMLLPAMLERGKGLILNISSVTSTSDLAFLGPYIATKRFIDAFSRQLELEYYNHPIDIINLNPAAVNTKLLQNSIPRFSKPTLYNLAPERFARSALNALACRITPYCGHVSHGLFSLLFELPHPDFIYKPLLERGMKIFGMKLVVSPVLKRKNTSAA